MSQITLYLDHETAVRLRQVAEDEGVSQSQWVARLIRERIGAQWPEAVRALAGAWSDVPPAEDIRAGGGVDAQREPL